MRVLDLNLWNINTPFESRMAVLADFIEEHSPDVMLFQEVSPHRGELQLATFLPQDYRFAYVEAGIYRGRHEGNAVVSRWPIEVLARESLPSAPTDVGRALVVCRVDDPAGTYNVAASHLAYKPEDSSQRLAQVDAIVDVLNDCLPDTTTPLVLGVDLNDVPSSESYNRLFDRLALRSPIDVQRAFNSELATFAHSNPFVKPELVPGRRIDYLLSCGKVAPTTFSLVMCEPSSLSSDHYGLMSDMVLT